MNLLLTLALALTAVSVQEPSRKELEKTVEAFLALDPRTSEGRADQLRLLEVLARAPEPDKSELSSWRETVGWCARSTSTGRRRIPPWTFVP